MHDIFFSSRHKVAFCCGRWQALNSSNSLYIFIYIYADQETPKKMGDFYVLVTWKEIQHVLWGAAGRHFFCWILVWFWRKQQISIPKDPWDWHIYLHLVDFYGFHVGKYYTIHASYGNRTDSSQVLRVLHSDLVWTHKRPFQGLSPQLSRNSFALVPRLTTESLKGQFNRAINP